MALLFFSLEFFNKNIKLLSRMSAGAIAIKGKRND